ncbi:hypothetical protein CDD83_8542 [Cordyceps sp. RAO-2017]|nr:hypothetical protein CDD83_8542 [Cordyceps sp. RAO-2017]
MNLSPTGDDFHPFLDVGAMAGLHFDLDSYQDAAAPPPFAARHQDDIPMHGSDPSDLMARSDGLLRHHAPAMPSSSVAAPPVMASSAPGDCMGGLDAQIEYLQRQKFHHPQQPQPLLDQQQQHHAAAFVCTHNHHSVPPTPQSLEMAPGSGSGHLFSQPDHVLHHSVYDTPYSQRAAEQQDMAFTPLVSPAVTPLDPQFGVDHAFAAPASYFSPLTSPAIRAQHEYGQSALPNDSPVEMDLDAVGGTPVNQDLARKARKNNAAKARGKAGIRSSPIAKAQRRWPGPSPAIFSQVLTEAEGRSVRPGDHSLLPMPADASDENASVSPENLTDMPPPPVPNRRSTSKSPYFRPQNGGPQPLAQRSPARDGRDGEGQAPQARNPPPATPASLMKLPGAEATRRATPRGGQNTATDSIESLELPESLNNGPLTPGGTASASPPSGVEAGAAKGPKGRVQPSPGTGSSEATQRGQSPQLAPSGAKKTPQLGSRNGRKRSTGSVQASPALLPKISPNIKPLLGGTAGASAEDTASRLLMSKSNYQNILEGNTVPGVSYPSELSTNLTSKRTSHKIAEQGRRNRINSALQVMAGLLPEHQQVEAAEEADKKDGKQSNVANSKASVVENAIVHMRGLQKENAELRQQVQELKGQLDRLTGSPAAAGPAG